MGEPVRISNAKGFYLKADVTALKDNGGDTSKLALDTQEAVPTDAKLSNPLHGGAGYKIIGHRLGNTRSRGIIVKPDDGIIKGNIITHYGLAIRIGPEWLDEADDSHNVVVDGSGVKQNQGITITNNRLTANTGRDISVAWADGVAITGSTFSGSPGLRGRSRSPRSRFGTPRTSVSAAAASIRPAYRQRRAEHPAVDAGFRCARKAIGPTMERANEPAVNNHPCIVRL